MHNLMVIAAFALAAVTPFMSAPPRGGEAEISDDTGAEAAQPAEDEPDGDQA